MRILVTGAAGFVGSNIALQLEKDGHSVVALDDFSSGHFENLLGFKGDIVSAGVFTARDFWPERVGLVDLIIHEAAITDTTVMDQKRMMEENVEAFREILSFAAAHKVKAIAYASSAAVYGGGDIPMRESSPRRPMNVYGFSKQIMENVAARFIQDHPDVRVAGVRYFNVFGSGEQFKGKFASMIWQLAQQMKAGRRPRIFEFGDQYRDFIYVKDVANATILAAKSAPSGVYNVCTGQKTTFNQIISNLNTVLGTTLEPEYFKNPYSFYQNETLGDPALAEKSFGFKARYSMALAIEDYFRGAVVSAIKA
jgi:ADP-L-glycero-D-manno-heptose 6-epimerase